jgi:CelD/BcsL family acetyltransferase involved in cellulose biosynthesis
VDLRIEIHHELDPLAAEWDDLADRVGASPFLRPRWFSAWQRAFGTNSPEVVAVRHKYRLAGVAALERKRLCLRSPTNWHTPAWAPLADSAAALEALCEAMVKRARPRLSLWFLDAGTDELTTCWRAAARCHARVYPLERSPYVTLDGTWEDYERRLTAKRRSNLRRMWRRLEESGTVELQVLDGRRDLARLLDEGFRVEASGWKGERGSAIDATPETRAFYEDVATWASRRGSLRLAFLRLDGRPLAFDFAIEEADAHALLKTGYDPEFRSFAPGVLLRAKMIQRAFGQSLATYEFLGDMVDWKREWTDSTRERVALEAFTPTPAGVVGWAAWAYARPAVNRLRDAPVQQRIC